jgi:hypothetical protein
MKLVEAGDDGRDEHFLKKEKFIHNVLFSNKPTDGAINIVTWRWLYNSNPFEGNFMRMADKLQGGTKDIVQPLMMRSLYSIERGDLFSILL